MAPAWSAILFQSFAGSGVPSPARARRRTSLPISLFTLTIVNVDIPGRPCPPSVERRRSDRRHGEDEMATARERGVSPSASDLGRGGSFKAGEGVHPLARAE